MPPVTCSRRSAGRKIGCCMVATRLLAASGLMLAAAAAGCSHAPARQARAPGTQPALRVMTYNVNFGIPGDGPTLAAIESGKADVVFLQEINRPWEQALRAKFAAAYPHMVFHPRGGAGGIGVMSRLPIRAQQLLARQE